MARPLPGTGAILLMAGQGTRFLSALPKVLHPVLGQPMGGWALAAIQQARIGNRVLVVGYRADLVTASFPTERTALQKVQKGTGNAVKAGLSALPKDCTTVVVVNGDSPLLEAESITALLKHHKKTKAACTIAVTWAQDPTGLGRVFTDERGRVEAIIEERDCTPEQRGMHLVNTGCYVFDRALLARYLKRLGTANAQGEELLTDIPKMLTEDRFPVQAIEDATSFAVMPNTRADLAMAGLILQDRILDKLYTAGVSIPEPDRVYIEPGVRIGADTIIWGGSYLRRGAVIGRGCTIGPHADITGGRIADEVTVRYAVLDDVTVGQGTTIGPYAHLRGGAKVGAKARIGNFVEVKHSTLADGVKASHLSYLGDATIGQRTNIGAGTITCNYDGVGKHPTDIGADVFVGSDSILVAPVTIGAGSLIAAGSVITEDVPAGHMAFGRARQENKPPRVLEAVKARQRAAKEKQQS